MGALKLVFGWLFLAAISAAGAFFGLDKLDSSVGLSRFHLHEKFGLARYDIPKPAPIPAPIPSPLPPSPSPSPGPAAVVPPSPGPEPAPGPGPAPIPKSADPIPVTPKRIPEPRPGPGPTTSEVTPTPPAPRPRTAEPEPAPPPTPKPPRDYDDVRSRFITVSSQADAVLKTWAGRRPSVGSFRPEIQSALTSLQRFVREADQALRGGDTASAKRYLDQAEKQMETLKDFE